MPFGQWFTLEVIADGNALAVLVNGKSSGYHVDRRKGRFSSGHIALQQYSPETVIEFRKIEIKELNRSNQKDPKEIGASPAPSAGLIGWPFRRTDFAFSREEFTSNTGEDLVEGTGSTAAPTRYGCGRWQANETSSPCRERDWAVRALALSSDGRYAASSRSSLSEAPPLDLGPRVGKTYP